MKSRSLFWGRRALSLLLVLLLAAGLLPAGLLPTLTPAAWASEEEIPLIEYDEEGRISALTITIPYTKVGDTFWSAFCDYRILPEGVDFHTRLLPTEYGFAEYRNVYVLERDTNRDFDFVGRRDELLDSDIRQEEFDYKDYIVMFYLSGSFAWFDEPSSGDGGESGQTYRRRYFSDDVKVYLRQHTDLRVTDRYTYLPAAYISPDDECSIWVSFHLDYTYYDSFRFEKKVIDLDGNPNAASFPIAWYNKDDVFGDGAVSYDPDTGTLHLKGDVDKFWLMRWAGTEPPRISIDDKVNVEQLMLSTEDADSLILEGAGTLNLGTLWNNWKYIITLSGCKAYIENWDRFTRVRLENAKLAGPEGAYLNTAGQVTDENGDRVNKNVAFEPAFLKYEDSGTVGTIRWHYDFVTKTFTVSGSGRFERLTPYDKYLDVMESFSVDSGVTELGTGIVKDSLHLRKVFLARTVERIGRNNFAGCKNLTEANLPIGLEYIMSGCFSGSGLKTVSVPRTLLRIDDGCFSNMPNLETVTFSYENADSFLVVGDGCFAHLPRAREFIFGDGPWIIGAGSFCDMPQLIKMRTAKLLSYESVSDGRHSKAYWYRIYLGEDLLSIGDYSFSDLPKVNYMEEGFSVLASRKDLFPICHYLYHLPHTILDIGRGSLGYLNGEAVNAVIDVEPSPQRDHFHVIMAARYGWACLQCIVELANKDILPSSEYKMGEVSYEWDGNVVSEYDVQALQDYLNRPLKAITPGSDKVGSGTRTPGSDVDFSGKVDHKDLILLKRRAAGWSGLDGYFDRDDLMDAHWGPDATTDSWVKAWRDACTVNYTATTGLELTVGSATVDYEDRAIVRVPVRSVSNTGYIGGSVTAKWDPEAMELVSVEYNDALAPNNGTGPIVNDLHYDLFTSEGVDMKLALDYAGEQVIRFGDDFRTSDIKGTGELFTLVFRLREGAKPSAYSATKTLDFEVALKGFDIYDAGLNFVRAEMTRAGTVTTRFGDAAIRTVSVTGVVPPFAGQHPSDSAVLPTDATYKLKDTVLGKVYWTLPPDENGRSQLVGKGKTFQAGEEYRVVIALEPASDAFTFAAKDELSVTVNGAAGAWTWVSEDGKEAYVYCSFTCMDGVAVNSVILNMTEAALTVGESTSVRVAAYDPYAATDLGVIWSSSDPSVAAVDPNGLVTALRAGAAVITATSINGGVQASCAVTVEKRQHTIRSVSAVSVSEPIDGRQPSFTAVIPSSAGYRLSVSGLFGGSVVWARKSGEYAYRMKEYETFQAGETYYVWVYLEPEETETDVYRFSAAEEMTATLNGREAKVFSANDDGSQIYLQYIWTAALPWSFDKETKTLTTSSAVTSAQPVIVASYDGTGRFLGSAFVMAAGKTGGVVKAGAKTISVFWLDLDTGKPIHAAEKITLG